MNNAFTKPSTSMKLSTFESLSDKLFDEIMTHKHRDELITLIREQVDDDKSL